MNLTDNMITPKTSTLQTTVLSKTFSFMTVCSKQVTFAKRPETISHIFEGNDIVEQYLESIILQNSGLVLVRNHKILLREDHDLMTNKVKILSGGSAGYEPLHSGFVGPGMLTASVFGELSSSPSYINILAAIRLLARHHSQGILVVVMNNIADRLNFGLACQQATREGIKVLCLTVGEDCSGVSVNKTIGRQGLCGLLFLHKVAGAMSEDNKTLFEIFSVLRALKGGSLGAVNVWIEGDGITIGSGLKGEPGKFSHHQTIPLIINEVLFYIFNPASYFSLHIEKGDSIAVIFNNLGKLSDFHLALIVKETVSRIAFMGIHVVRIYSGRFLTTKTVGFSVCVLKLTENVLHWLDSPTCVLSWPKKVSKAVEAPLSFKNRCTVYLHKTDSWSLDDSEEFTLEEKSIGPRFTLEQATLVVAVLENIVTALTNMEEYLNKIDFDHDYGTNIKKFMDAIKQAIFEKTLHIVTPFGLFNNLAELAATSMGGVSGAVYSVFFSAAAQAFLTTSKFNQISWQHWMDAVRMARDSLCAYSHAKPGYRTVVDALDPFVKTFTYPTVTTLSKAVNAAMAGAENTTAMSGVHRYPDSGAYSLAVALRVMFTELQIDLMTLETESEEIWYCSDCLEDLESEGIFFCGSCVQLMEEM